MERGELSDFYYCPVNGRTVLFDVLGDRYLLVPGAVQAELDAWLADDAAPCPAFLAPLLATRCPAPSGCAIRLSRAGPMVAPIRALERDRSGRFLTNLLSTWRTKRMAARIRGDLARLGLAAVLERIRAEKLSIADPLDPGPFARQLRAALGHRAITGDCLVQSLAMMRLLHRQHSTATLAFGVTLDPFRAHSWVQHGNCVLNDEADAVASYRPIFTL